MYGIKIFNSKKIKEMIQAIGLNDFIHEKKLDRLKSPSIDEIIEFVYYECLPLIPYQVIEAFSQAKKLRFFKKSITEYLRFIIKMRIEFENSLAEPPKSLLKFLEKVGVEQDQRYYDDLKKINNFYGEAYHQPTKEGTKRTQKYQVTNFQQQLFALTIKYRSKNPLFSRTKKEYIEIQNLHQLLSQHREEGFSKLTARFLIESTYNFNFMKQATKYFADTESLSPESLKNIILFGLLPNVFSRNQFIDVLIPYSKTCDSTTKINIGHLFKNFFQLMESEIPDNLQVNRKNKQILLNQFYVENYLKHGFSNYIKKYQSLTANQKLEEWLISLAQFTFPLMEMYTYYLIKEIFNVQLDISDNQFSYEIEDIELEENEIYIFNIIAPAMYDIKSKKFDCQLPVTQDYIEFLKLIRSFPDDTLSRGFYEDQILESIYNAHIISQDIIFRYSIQFDEFYYENFKNDKMIRSFERIGYTMK